MTSARGGAREGAGRPSLGATQRLEVRLSPEDLATLDALAASYEIEGTKGPRALTRSEAIRLLIDRVRASVDRLQAAEVVS